MGAREVGIGLEWLVFPVGIMRPWQMRAGCGWRMPKMPDVKRVMDARHWHSLLKQGIHNMFPPKFKGGEGSDNT